MNKDLQKQIHATAHALAVQLIPLLNINRASKDQALNAIGVACDIASKSALEMHTNLQRLIDDSIKTTQTGDKV